MGLFKVKVKKKTEEREFNPDAKHTVKILGGGCKKCNTLEENTIEALDKLNISANIVHVTDFAEISKYGVMQTPALVFDEKVLSSGKVLSVNEVIELLK